MAAPLRRQVSLPARMNDLINAPENQEDAMAIEEAIAAAEDHVSENGGSKEDHGLLGSYHHRPLCQRIRPS